MVRCSPLAQDILRALTATGIHMMVVYNMPGFLSQLLNCSYAKASLSCSVVKGFLEGTHLSINDTILLYVDRHILQYVIEFCSTSSNMNSSYSNGKPMLELTQSETIP